MIDAETRREIKALKLPSGRPLVICDVDEVIVRFVARLELHLAERGCWLDKQSFALNGNIRRLGSDAPLATAEVRDLLTEFLSDHTATFDPVEGAVDALNELGEIANVVLLTNMPRQHSAKRTENLRGHGLEQPVVTNAGYKGPAVSALMNDVEGPSVFLDDSDGNLASVREHRPDVALIHFINDLEFAAVAPEVEGAALKTSSWREAAPAIRRLIREE